MESEDKVIAAGAVALFLCLALVSWAMAWKEVRLAEIKGCVEVAEAAEANR